MASERYKSDEMVKSWVDGKRYYVMTVAVGDSAYLTAVYPTNFLGLVSRGKPLLAKWIFGESLKWCENATCGGENSGSRESCSILE